MTRTEAEVLFGAVKVAHVFPPIPSRNFDYEAYFDDLLDLGMPNWARASGSTEEEALTELLAQAAEHHAERSEGDNGESREWLSGMNLLGRNL